MISIGIAQTVNSIKVEDNFKSILKFLDRLQKGKVDLVVFPECALSGFSSKINECTIEMLGGYLEIIQCWSIECGIDVILPTAIAEGEKKYNSGFCFQGKSKRQFFKTGLTESEKLFFSSPGDVNQRMFEFKGYKCGLLLCFEAQQEPWVYLSETETDIILWPGYWGWTKDSKWAEESELGKPNPTYLNMKQWQVPLIQANFAFNSLDDHRSSGPQGLSFVVNSDNKLIHRGAHAKEDGFIVKIDRINGKAWISDYRLLPEC